MAVQEPEGRAAFVEASVLYHEGSYDQSIVGYQRTIALHHEVPFSKMMIARLWGLKGDVEKGIEALNEAAEYEFGGAQMLLTDPEFAPLRAHPRFPDVLAKVRASIQPCKNVARRRQFDFWIGEWTVTRADGREIGTDRIELVEGDCMLRETWTGSGGDTGQSHTFYDRLTGYWRQVWMDPGGQGQDFYGELDGQAMVFQQTTYNGGGKVILRVSYEAQPDGTIRQLGERSVAIGIPSWTTIYTYTLTRKAQ